MDWNLPKKRAIMSVFNAVTITKMLLLNKIKQGTMKMLRC
jgi:hypothetical protein